MTTKEHEAIKFAKVTAERLTAYLDGDPGCKLALFAPPRFLGHVRAELSASALDRIEWVIHKDLSALSPHELASRMDKYF